MLRNNRTPWQMRFEADFPGKMIPFGAYITYMPNKPVDVARIRKFGSQVLDGIFVGYHEQYGGFWSGDFFIVDWEELEMATDVDKINVKRFKADEVQIIYNDKGEFRSPIVEGDLKQPGDEKHTKEITRKVKKTTVATEEQDKQQEEQNVEVKVEPEVILGDLDSPDQEQDKWTFNGDILIR